MEFLRNKSILITGATGMVGSRIVRKVLEANDKSGLNAVVIAVYRNEEKKNAVFSDCLDRGDIKWLCADVTKPIEYGESVDYIVHTAAVTGGSRQHIDFPMRTISTAIDSTVNLLELAREKKSLGFVVTSSLEVYGKTDYSMPSIKETDGGYIDPMAVRSSYSESKRMCENICAAYAKQFGIPAKVVRLTASYGGGAYYGDKRVLCEFARCVIEKKDIVLKSLGDTVRNYCDTLDAADAILTVLEKGERGEAYNVANMATDLSIKELAERFIALYPESGITLKFDIPEDITKLGYNGTVKIRLDTEKLEKLGWKPKFGADDMIRHLVSAMRESLERSENNG